MFPNDKINAIRDHLRSKFPNHDIVYDEALDGIKFRLTYQAKSHLINFEGSFIDDHDAYQILNYLQRNPFGWLLSREDIAEVIVTNVGRKLKYKEPENTEAN